MLRALSILCLSVTLSAGQKWPALKTTFSINPFSGFNAQPMTSAEAEAAGWELLASCDGKFLGHRYANPADFSLVLIYDDAGYIAGSQSVLPLQHIDSSLFDSTVMPAYQLDMWYDQEAYFATAYFVDPSVICTGGRSSEEFESQGTGDRLMVQMGETPDSLVNIPLTREVADMDPVWFDHKCFPGMGDHYLQFNYQPDQNYLFVLPLQIFYSEGVMAIGAIIDCPATCILSTMLHTSY